MKISAISNQNYMINSNSNNYQKSPAFGQFHATKGLIKDFAASGIPAEQFAKFKQLDTKSLSRKILDDKLSKDLQQFLNVIKDQVNLSLSNNGFSVKEIFDVLKSQEITDFRTKFLDEYKSGINKIFADNGSDFDIYVNFVEMCPPRVRAVVPGVGGSIKRMDYTNKGRDSYVPQVLPSLEEMTKEDFIIDTVKSTDIDDVSESPVAQNMFREHEIKRAALPEELDKVLQPIIENRNKENEAKLAPYRYLM